MLKKKLKVGEPMFLKRARMIEFDRFNRFNGQDG